MSAVSFEIEGKKYGLYFGMDAYEVIYNFLVKSEIEKPSVFTSASYIIYGGLVNRAILDQQNKPAYADAYMLCEKIYAMNDDFQKSIFDPYNDSIAKKELTKKVDELKKEAETVKKKDNKKSTP